MLVRMDDLSRPGNLHAKMKPSYSLQRSSDVSELQPILRRCRTRRQETTYLRSSGFTNGACGSLGAACCFARISSERVSGLTEKSDE
jgi:hypothetical protein